MAHTCTAPVLFAVLFVAGALCAAVGSSEEDTTEGGAIDTSRESFAVVRAAPGHTVTLPCNMPINSVVSWIRIRDMHILTVGKYSYTNDDRFGVRNEGRDWLLVIRQVQTKDSGVYECAVRNPPNTRHRVHLFVSEPKAKILGGPTRSVIKGDSLNLTCVIEPSPRPEIVIYWMRLSGDVIHRYSGRTTIVEGSDSSVSNTLLIDNISLADAGQYTCRYNHSAGNSIDCVGRCEATVTVHVLDRRHEEAVGEAEAFPVHGAGSELEAGSTAETTTEEASGTGKRRKLDEYETDETKGLTLDEVQRLVALKQLRVLRQQEEANTLQVEVLRLQKEKLVD